MEFGAVTHAVGHHQSFEKTLAVIKELGFDSILLLTKRGAATVSADGTCPDAFPDVLASDPAHVRKAMENSGLKIGALHFNGQIEITSDDGVERTTAALREYADCAVSLGCRNLTMPVPGCGGSHVPTEKKTAEIKRLGACMNAVAEEYAGKGLTVSVDVHHSAWVEGVEDCRLLVDSMPAENAGILLNIGHMTTTQAYGWLLVDEYPRRIPVVGWKDHSLAKDRPRPMWSIELGTGHSPFELYIRAFKRHPAERVHLVNCENVADEERVAALGRSLQYIRRLWETVE